MNKILVVGQTPPPYHGQALAIERILKGEYRHAKLFHARMGFAKDNDDLGTVRVGKITHLLGLLLQIAWMRITKNIKVLYYPPSGPKKIAVYRDIVILCLTRWMFAKTIFHFHAGGISELYPRLNPIARFFFRRAFYRCDLALVLSNNLPPDHLCVKAKKTLVLPLGVQDMFNEHLHKPSVNVLPHILFVAVLHRSKGVFDLLQACHILKMKGFEFAVDIVGMFPDKEIEAACKTFIQQQDMMSNVVFHGVLKGTEIAKVYANADLFCFPTYYESEALPQVVIEAMQFSLPVVATAWRGVVDQVEEGHSGFLTPSHDINALAERLGQLLADPALRAQMGRVGRTLYLKKYTLDVFYQKFDECLSQA